MSFIYNLPPKGSDEDTWVQSYSFRAIMFLYLKLTW